MEQVMQQKNLRTTVNFETLKWLWQETIDDKHKSFFSGIISLIIDTNWLKNWTETRRNKWLKDADSLNQESLMWHEALRRDEKEP